MFLRETCIILYLLAFCVKGDGEWQPMVAFQCNRPSVHLTEGGWLRDESTGCLKDPEDILSYCRKMYPSLDIRNVIEADTKAVVPNWCDFGRANCHEQFVVWPIRCLVGPFQSESLLVPDHCAFHHFHESKICMPKTYWIGKSSESCAAKRMTRHSQGMLQPCAVGKFSGIEFVCCPDNTSQAQSGKMEIKEEGGQMGKSKVSSTQTRKPGAVYKWNEHDYYVKAKSDMMKYHHDKVAKMMKDWAIAQQRVESLKSVDAKASEKLDREITSRFQKMYEAEEAEAELEKKQLELLHQKRIQAELNRRKQKIFSDFVQVVQDGEAEPSAVVRSLRRLIKVLRRDRMHAVGLFARLKDSDVIAARLNEEQVRRHLKRSDDQLDDALDLLGQLNDTNNIRKEIGMDLDYYRSLDDAISALLPERPEEVKPPEEKEDMSAIGSPAAPHAKMTTPGKEVRGEDVLLTVTSAPSVLSAAVQTPFPGLLVDVYDDYLDGTDYVPFRSEDRVANIEKNDLQVNEPVVIEKIQTQHSNSFSSAILLGVAVSGITVLVIIVVGVVVIRGCSRRSLPRCQGTPRLDSERSPEEHDVTGMQMNGYENPTYKYFETNTK